MPTSTDSGLSRWQDGWKEYSGINGIPTTGISAILSSRDGQVWLGVPGLGVQRWLGYDHVESWTRAQGLGANPIWSIVPVADHSVLLATRAGCARLDQIASVVAPCPFGNLPPGEIRVMAQGRSALWFGTTTGELFRILTGDRNATWIAHVAEMRKFYVDSSHQLWIGTTGGVAVVAPHSTQIDSLQLPVPAGEVADITQDADGAIWLAGQGGLLRWSGAVGWEFASMASTQPPDSPPSQRPAAVGSGWVPPRTAWCTCMSRAIGSMRCTGSPISCWRAGS